MLFHFVSVVILMDLKGTDKIIAILVRQMRCIRLHLPQLGAEETDSSWYVVAT